MCGSHRARSWLRSSLPSPLRSVSGASGSALMIHIPAFPDTLSVSSIINASEVNFLCVHKKLRSKRLAPVLIKEVTRQCNLRGVFQALYTAGVLIPTPVSSCRYVPSLRPLSGRRFSSQSGSPPQLLPSLSKHPQAGGRRVHGGTLYHDARAHDPHAQSP